jgi:hypothetical protein
MTASEDEGDTGGGFKVDIGAKAELKAEVKTEVPAETTGRILDSLLDIIRPFTERRGLKADLIKIQREEVALEIVKLGRQKLELANEKPKPIPIKGLVPLLEQCSLEEDDELFELWAELLASASADYDSAVMAHTHTLSQIGEDGARILSDLVDVSRQFPTRAKVLEGYRRDLSEIHSEVAFTGEFLFHAVEKELDDLTYHHMKKLADHDVHSDYGAKKEFYETRVAEEFTRFFENCPAFARGPTVVIVGDTLFPIHVNHGHDNLTILVLCRLQVLEIRDFDCRGSRARIHTQIVVPTELGCDLLCRIRRFRPSDDTTSSARALL